MKRLLPWFAAMGLLVVIFGTIYGVVQQAQRSDANYPQIQLAQNLAYTLDRRNELALPLDGHVDIAKNLAPFTIVYDKKGNVVSGSGYLDGKVPKAPLGTLKAAEGQDYHAVTWEPKKD